MKIYYQATIFMAGVICGCLLIILLENQTIKKEYAIGDKKVIDKIIEDELKILNIDDIVKEKNDDVYVVNGKIGKNIKSRFKRIAAASDGILGKIKASIPGISTIELFDSFMSSGYNINEVMYFVARDGNEMIADELIARNDTLVKLIKNWHRDVFNGGNGGIMLNPIVDMLNKNNK